MLSRAGCPRLPPERGWPGRPAPGRGRTPESLRDPGPRCADRCILVGDARQRRGDWRAPRSRMRHRTATTADLPVSPVSPVLCARPCTAAADPEPGLGSPAGRRLFSWQASSTYCIHSAYLYSGAGVERCCGPGIGRPDRASHIGTAPAGPVGGEASADRVMDDPDRSTEGASGPHA